MVETKRKDRQQALYDIALSIGESLDLFEMLKKALSAYLKNLECSAALVYRARHTKGTLTGAVQVLSIPYTLVLQENFAPLDEVFPEQLTPEAYRQARKETPYHGKTSLDQHYHVLDIGDFGLLVLLKDGSLLEKD